MSKTIPMPPDAAARIQRAEALSNDGKVDAGTFPAKVSTPYSGSVQLEVQLSADALIADENSAGAAL